MKKQLLHLKKPCKDSRFEFPHCDWIIIDKTTGIHRYTAYRPTQATQHIGLPKPRSQKWTWSAHCAMWRRYLAEQKESIRETWWWRYISGWLLVVPDLLSISSCTTDAATLPIRHSRVGMVTRKDKTTLLLTCLLLPHTIHFHSFSYFLNETSHQEKNVQWKMNIE